MPAGRIISPGSLRLKKMDDMSREKVRDTTDTLDSPQSGDYPSAEPLEESNQVQPVKEPAPDKTHDQQLRQAAQPEALQLIPDVMARRYNAIPISISGHTLKVAMADPTDIFALEAFSAQSKKRIKPIAADARGVRSAIDFNYTGHGEIEQQISNISIPADALDERLAIDAAIDAPLAQALNLIIEEAVRSHSSDIHIEPGEDRVRIRYRIDGTLHDMMSLPISIHRAIVSRIKILADMNIADHHRAQDGQFSTKAKGREIDVRVATSPTVLGEMAVLRLLDKSQAAIGLAELGLLPDSLEKYENLLKVPYGMILISGPTGAGRLPPCTPPSTPWTRWAETLSPLKTLPSTVSATSTRFRSTLRRALPLPRGCGRYFVLTLIS